MSKKLWTLFLALALAVSMSACGRAVDSSDDEQDGRPVKKARSKSLPAIESPEASPAPGESPNAGNSPEASPEMEFDGNDGIIPEEGLYVLNGGHAYNLEAVWVYEDLSDLEPDGLALLRNAVYASKGYIFKNEKYTELFSQYAWYKPERKNVEDLLSETDKLNLNLVLKLEGNFDALYPVLDETEKQMVGFWQKGYPGVAAGYGMLYVLEKDRTATFKENEMDGEERLRALYGRWYVLNDQLYMKMTGRDVIVGGKLEPASGSTATEYEIVGGKLVHEELDKPSILTLKLNFDQAALEYGDDCFGVLLDGEEYYDLEERYFE